MRGEDPGARRGLKLIFGVCQDIEGVGINHHGDLYRMIEVQDKLGRLFRHA